MFKWLDVKLVGGFNPVEKYDRHIGSFPQVGMKIKNIWNHHLARLFFHFDFYSATVGPNIPNYAEQIALNHKTSTPESPADLANVFLKNNLLHSNRSSFCFKK